MKKICFGNGIKAQDDKMCNLTVSIKGSLKEVYRLPNDLKNISNCFNNCTNLSVFNANIPNSVENMSNSFKSCKNLFKNISIPSNCINMAYAFSNVPANGTKFIPNKVTNITGSFENSKINEIVFEDRNADDLNNILNMASAFSNSSLESVTLLDGLKIGNAYRAFSTCPIERIRSDLNVDNGCEMFRSSNIKSVQNIKSNSANSMFLSSLYLKKVGAIESNNFYYTFDNCRSMKEMGNITGNLAFKHTFRNCGVGDTGTDSYSNVIYLKPYKNNNETHLFIEDENDGIFLNSHPLRIYGRGHGLENELNFINGHGNNGDYISGYCDPNDFSISLDSNYSFGKYDGDTDTLIIPRYMRTNLLDSNTTYIPSFYQSFNGKNFYEVKIYGDSKFSTNCFVNQSTSVMTILGNPNFYIDIDGTNSCFGDINSTGLKNCHVDFQGGNTTPVFANSGIKSFNNLFTVSNIKDYSFSRCFSLNSLGTNSEYFLSKINIFGNGAFKDCNNLSMIININNASYIGREAFKNVEKSNKIQFPDRTKALVVDNNAFNGCYGVREISNIFSGVYIYSDAFYNIGKTKNQDGIIEVNPINVLSSEGTIYTNAFSNLHIKNFEGSVLYKDLFSGSFPSSLTNVTFTKWNANSNLYSSHVENITLKYSYEVDHSGLFSNLSYLKNIHLERPTYISTAIKNSPNIEHITGYGFLKTGQNSSYGTWLSLGVFSDMPKLKTLNIAGNITGYAGDFIRNCPNLENVSIKGTVVFNNTTSIFSNCYNVKNINIGNIVFSYYNYVAYYGKHFGKLFNTYTLNTNITTSSPKNNSELINGVIKNMPTGNIPHAVGLYNRTYVPDDGIRKFEYKTTLYYGPSNLKLENINIGRWYWAPWNPKNVVSYGLTQGLQNLQSVKINNLDLGGSSSNGQLTWFSNTPNLNNIIIYNINQGTTYPLYWFDKYSNGVANTNSQLNIKLYPVNYGVSYGNSANWQHGVSIYVNDVQEI